MQAAPNSQKVAAPRKSPGPPQSSVPPGATAQVTSPDSISQQRTSAQSTKATGSNRRPNVSVTYRRCNFPNQTAPNANSPPLSQIEKSVTHLLVATKQLLETLTQWSRRQATDAQVSDVYVRLGYEFNIACRAFTTINVDTSDLGNVPDLLRNILESTLSQEASVESLEKYLPQIRDIIINLLHGLKRKQQRLRQKQNRSLPPDSSGTRNASLNSIGSSSGGTIPGTISDQGTSDNFQRNNENRSSTSANDTAMAHRGSMTLNQRAALTRDQIRSSASSGESSISSAIMQTMPVLPPSKSSKDISAQTRISSSNSMVDSFPPPPPPPKISTNALAALQRGGELERRASKRYSAYQISKHLGASPNGVPILPQNTPIPNRGRNDTMEGVRAVQNRGQPRRLHSARPSNDLTSSSRSSKINGDDSLKSADSYLSPNSDGNPSIVLPDDISSINNSSTQSLPSITLPQAVNQPSNTISDDAEKVYNQASVKSSLAYTLPGSVRSRSEEITSAEASPRNEKELTLFLQYKTKVKKFVLVGGYSDLSIARLQLAFIEKFAWNTHHNGVDLPEIFIQDPVSGVRHELEDLDDVKDRSVLVLNIETLDEGVRTAVDDQQVTIQRVSDRQQETAKEIARIKSSPPSIPHELKPESRSNSLNFSPKKVDNIVQQQELQAIRRDLAVVRQTYSTFQSDIQDSMNVLRKTAENVKTAAAKASIPDLTGESGRSYVDRGKKGLDKDSDKLVAQVDDLQDLVEDLRKDVVLRGVRPLPRQLEDVSKDISQAAAELKKMQDFLKRERPIWTKIWEKELERVCKDREDMTLIEDLIVDLEDDLSKASQTFALVEEATQEQSKDPPGSTSASRALSRGLSNVLAADPATAKEGVLDEVRALQPNHENRIEAIQRAEKLRQKELESRRAGEFEKELGSFVEEGKLKKSGGFEEVERARKQKDERIRMEVWERQNGMTQAGAFQLQLDFEAMDEMESVEKEMRIAMDNQDTDELL
ncbi:actin-interacting protein (Bud6/Aip3) [Blumeria hordei DH14]|uniref:Actin-interacting protein (Bud6/Aip3) n=1 Tax=Blumeria graminis f. sp. hordei (strain DH14) TaxID=546991 RepID=N1J8J0_BLUG1|nr:actin-interacting protein (Bud6/Aip3) [Blumeria hordei DH14]